MTKAYKFRLYPTDEQESKLVNALDACRWLYNYFLNKNIQSKEDMQFILTELKEQEPWLNSYHSKMLQMVVHKIDSSRRALKVLRKNGHKVGKLHFIERDEYDTFTYNQSGFKIERHGNTDLLWLSKIGYIEIRMHRSIGGIKQVTVTRKNERWYACVVCEKGFQVPQLIDSKKCVGIDVGIRNYVYDSDNNTTPNPANLRKMLKPLIRANRKISRRVKDSNNYKKAVRWYKLVHERIVNRRKDFLHKLSTQYANKYDVIFLERLYSSNMVKNRYLARSIMDASWSTFKQMVGYKSKLMIEVPANDTTIDCSRCGNKVAKSLAARIHRCDRCDLVVDRDYNASLNILQRGLQILGMNTNQELLMAHEEVTPVETLVVSMKQEEAHAFRHG